MQSEYKVLGIMSGTSLDGLDLAICNFTFKNNGWSFTIDRAETIAYSENWKEQLLGAPYLSALEFIRLHNSYGELIGNEVNSFLNGEKVDLISSHGHTIYHQIENKLTFQVGSGASIAAKTGITTVSDFRTLDVALGGHGAPLVPIGDQLLFPDYSCCINLGGIANLSFARDNQRIAYDICPLNMALNKICLEELGREYDSNGDFARSGNINRNLLIDLQSLEYFKQEAPKSLAREWFQDEFIPILNKFNLSSKDKLRTLVEFMAIEIANNTTGHFNGGILLSGGGALNRFLVERINDLSHAEVIVPKKEIVEFKEALIFAFLGVLRIREEFNCLKSVTGAKHNNVGGIVHLIK